jgi:hypothetical protein
MVRAGESRTSSVLALKASPSTAIRLSATDPPSASRILLNMKCLCRLLTRTTVSMISTGECWSLAVLMSASVSLGKHEPP